MGNIARPRGQHIEERDAVREQSADLEVLQRQSSPAETMLRGMALFVEFNPGPVLRFDRKGFILSANPAAIATLGEEAKEGVLLVSLLPSTKEIDFKRCIREGLVIFHETRVGHRHFHFVIRGVPDLGMGHIYGSDITERKQAEETLQEVAVLKERNRLAREIHDTLAQGLTAIIWQLNVAERVLKSGGGDGLQPVEQARNLARECLQEARRPVWDLRAGPLGGHTLAEALRQEVEKITGNGEIRTLFSMSGDERVLPSGEEAAILRICQESLANIIKYANATEVTVRLDFDDSKVQLTVQDNGDGFDSEPSRKG